MILGVFITAVVLIRLGASACLLAQCMLQSDVTDWLWASAVSREVSCCLCLFEAFVLIEVFSFCLVKASLLICLF